MSDPTPTPASASTPTPPAPTPAPVKPGDHPSPVEPADKPATAEPATRPAPAPRSAWRAFSGFVGSAAGPFARVAGRGWNAFFALRGAIPKWQAALYGLLCVAVCLGLWWFATRGEPELRILGPTVLPSPGETWDSFHSLWFDRALTRNVFITLRRVALGFGLAAVIGIPIGVLCGCFSRIAAFFAPLSIFGRNIPVAALIPLTFSLFGIGETQKIMFIFIACVAFVFSDTARAISDVGSQYIDTAYTLGANRRQVILKVLVPQAMPSIFNSLRLLFGLAFGYIMLAELIKLGGEQGGLGDIIITSQRRGIKEHILLVLIIIPIVALGIDRLLFWIQKELFPHRYGGTGLLNKLVRGVLRLWEDFKGLFWKPRIDVSPISAISPGPEDKNP